MTLKLRHNLFGLAAKAVGIALVATATAAHANFVGGDNFNDNFTDPARWGADINTAANAAFTETNGRVELSRTSPTGFAFVARPWIQNTGSYTANWSVQVDAHITSNQGSLGLQVMPSNVDPITGSTFSFLSFFHNPTLVGPRFIGGNVTPNGTQFQTVPNAVDVGLRYAFDASTKILSLQYDADAGANGYNWLTISDVDLGPLGVNWGLNDASTFSLFLTGSQLEGFALEPGNLYLDNLVLTSASTVPVPASLPLMLIAMLGMAAARVRVAKDAQR